MIVTDANRVLIAHATRSPRWDIPKGIAEAGETPEQTARRELLEETGLQAPAELLDLGQHVYLPRKDLALFAWLTPDLPDPGTLICRSTFLIGTKPLPEFDRFACVSWAEAFPLLGKSMRIVLTSVAQKKGWV